MLVGRAVTKIEAEATAHPASAEWEAETKRWVGWAMAMAHEGGSEEACAEIPPPLLA